MWKTHTCLRLGLLALLAGSVPLAFGPYEPAHAATVWTAVDAAAAAGLAEVNETWGACTNDYDGDGRQDVMVVYHDQGAKLYRNIGGGRYTRVATTAWPMRSPEGKVPDRHDCGWADFNADGRQDVYLSAGRSGSNAVKHGMDNELWLQSAQGVFTEVGTLWNVGDLCGRSHYNVAFDANNDGFPDVFVGNAIQRAVADPCDDPSNGLPNEEMKLYLNNAGRELKQAPAVMGIAGYGGVRCAEAADLNRDGWKELLTCGDPGNRLFRNNAGTSFSDVTAARGLGGTKFSGASFGDLDRDGDLDLVSIVWGQVSYRLNDGTGRFGSNFAIKTLQAGRNLALGDADGNGTVDVYALTGNVGQRSNPNDYILLNNGLRFTEVGVPASAGIGDTVVALEGDNDGKAEFLVLNGAEDTRAANQLISLVASAN